MLKTVNKPILERIKYRFNLIYPYLIRLTLDLLVIYCICYVTTLGIRKEIRMLDKKVIELRQNVETNNEFIDYLDIKCN
jgi:hypothetical protein